MMAETETDQCFEGDHETATTTTTSFSQLLFGGGGGDDVVGLDLGHSFNYSTCSSNTPKMLCFGSHPSSINAAAAAAKITAAVGFTCTDSSSASYGTTNNTKTSKRKWNGDQESKAAIVEAKPANRRSINKKSKAENSTASTGHAKVRKEKIGDRITALQQLVSPFGKTDTASVLHEAMGYIRFLHDQVQVLCSPYLQHPLDDGNNGEDETSKELKSRGLCLVPVACTVHVADSNGADYWSPAMGNDVLTKQ